MKRKLLALVCTLALLAALAAPASAACPWRETAANILQTTLSGKSTGTSNLYSYLHTLLQSRFKTADTTAAGSEPQETESGDAAQPVQDQEAKTGTFSQQAQEILELVNAYRARYGLSALTLDATLCTVAQVKAQDLHDNRYFSHQSPTYGSPYDLMAEYEITYRAAGENIAMGYASAQAVMTAWENSAGHRANLLNASYTTLGVGYVADGGYFVQEFIG